MRPKRSSLSNRKPGSDACPSAPSSGALGLLIKWDVGKVCPSRRCLVQQISNLSRASSPPPSPGCPDPCGLFMLRSGQRTFRRGTAGHGGHFIVCHKDLVTTPAQGFTNAQAGATRCFHSVGQARQCENEAVRELPRYVRKPAPRADLFFLLTYFV